MPFYPYYLFAPKDSFLYSVRGEVNTWETPNRSYEEFVTGVTQAYNAGDQYGKFYSDYVTRYFDDRITGGTTGGVYVTGGTANSADSTLVFTNTSGTSFTVANSPLLFNDAYISGGTLNAVTGVVTFTNTTGGTFGVSGFDGFTSYWSANTDGSISQSGLTTYVGIGTVTPEKTFHVKTVENVVAVFESSDATAAIKISDSTDDAYLVAKNSILYISKSSGSPSSNAKFAFDYVNGKLGVGTTTPNEALTVSGAISGTTDLYIGDNIRGLRGQFGNLPSAAGANRDLEIKGDDSVYLRLQSTTNANQTIEFMNDQEPDFLIYNKHTDGGLYIASDDKTFLVIGANDADTIDLYGNTIISGNTTLSGNTSYSGTISGTGSVTAIGGFVGEVTGNAATATKIASITNANIVQLAETQTLTNKTLTAPTLTTPALGTPASGVLTNTTGYPGDSNLVTTGVVTSGTWGSNRKFTESDTDVASTGGVDIVYFGSEASTVPGAVYIFNGSQWEGTDANALATSTGLTAVALGETNLAGMVIRGMVTLAVTPLGVDGNALYLNETISRVATIPPTTSGAIVRVMGYVVDTSKKTIWFNPDNTWVELS